MTKEELQKISKPILFNTDMVRAILDGRKTTTRRVVKPSVWKDFVCEGGEIINYLCPKTDELKTPMYKSPYQVSDILYVRETWSQMSYGYEYRADGKEIDHLGNVIIWHPSIHMPKEAARIFLKVTDVRVERLQDIDDNGVAAEGLEIGSDFDELWDSTIKKSNRDRYGWNANPWVWVIEFERIYPDD